MKLKGNERLNAVLCISISNNVMLASSDMNMTVKEYVMKSKGMANSLYTFNWTLHKKSTNGKHTFYHYTTPTNGGCYSIVLLDI